MLLLSELADSDEGNRLENCILLFSPRPQSHSVYETQCAAIKYSKPLKNLACIADYFIGSSKRRIIIVGIMRYSSSPLREVSKGLSRIVCGNPYLPSTG